MYLTKVQNLANQVLADLRSGLHVDRDADLHMDMNYYAPGYEQPNEKASEAIKMLARLEGLFVDPVYTGKALAGLIDHIRTDKVEQGSNVVFWHTGGATALSDCIIGMSSIYYCGSCCTCARSRCSSKYKPKI